MKEVKSTTGETELQSEEYAAPGPVRTMTPRESLALIGKRLDVLEAQVKSLQCSIPRELPRS